MDYTYTWGLYQCFEGTNDDMVSESDRESFFSLKPNGKVFQCVAVNSDGKLILKYGCKTFQVDPHLYKIVSEPMFKINEKVEIIEKSIIGQVEDIIWHIKDNVPFYTLSIDGKKLSRRYEDYDLRKI